MKRNLLFTFITLIGYQNIFAQNSLVKQWDYRFGGISSEQLSSIQQTNDGGFILGGWSGSEIDGDKTQDCRGVSDYWIVKIDSVGNKQWDKRFGGADGDNLFELQQTSDGGYILGGNSNSGISGDKTQNNRDTTLVTSDYWIVKIDSIGNKQWDQRFGGTGIDRLSSLKQTSDGGYILGGYSYSGIGGDKTQNNWDTTLVTSDYWIIKIDSLGNKQWDKVFGGKDYDLFTSLDITCDGGYILGGYSNSDVSDDKTQNNWDTTLNTSDYWIVKINSLGNKQWDKRFGGTMSDFLNSLQQTSDGGYILGGRSVSGIDGDKTQPNWGGTDFWMVKIDSLGNKEWDKDLGGTSGENVFGNITQTCDGGYLLAGASYSDISGDKTENNLAHEQTWVAKTDLLGNKQWDKTLLTNLYEDESGYAIQTANGNYVMANMTPGGIGGDKTQPSWGLTDYWIIKFTDAAFIPCTPHSPCSSTDGVSRNHFLPELSIYPNPFSADVSITIKKNNIRRASLIIRNMLGQIILRNEEINLSNTYTKTIDLNNLERGIYFLDIIIDGERSIKKVVKE